MTEKNEIKKAKGLVSNVVDNKMTLNNYKKIVYGWELGLLRKMPSFKSSCHTITTNVINKIALTNFDDKQYI